MTVAQQPEAEASIKAWTKNVIDWAARLRVLRRSPQLIKGWLVMTPNEFREAVDSLGDKFLAAITSQRPINIGVTLAAAST
jgi:hypothetical protein